MGINRRLFSFSLVVGLVALFLATPTGVHGAQLKEIEQRGKLIVAVKDNLRPLGFRDQAGNLQGLEIDIAKRLAEELLGKADAVVLQSVKNSDRLNVVLDGKVDLTIAAVTLTNPRSRIVDFSRPYYLDGTGFVTKNTSITQLNDLATKRIAVIEGSSTIPVVRHNLPNVKLIGVKSYDEARSLLEKSGTDAFAADNSVLAGWVQEYPDYRMLPVRLSAQPLCVVMPKGLQYTKLQERVDKAIATWQASGWLAERVADWGLP
jgi:polar amino acid transport system substrate-binding protein